MWKAFFGYGGNLPLTRGDGQFWELPSGDRLGRMNQLRVVDEFFSQPRELFNVENDMMVIEFFPDEQCHPDGAVLGRLSGDGI
ncbi:hypothetical protein DPMN_065625 [Dreissena polymorpha]|uniref:Uncharacterized protein n=1 Tax=Dreissena polymorpha TaxID=45954 RepID=A0A9D3YWB2_DREPO|nr:hypothetical protein DPMN_065625 [Dreissena polymorpha]